MDKIIYVYLITFVVIYGLYRINSNEHFSDNTTVYFKSKYNIQEPDLNKIKQFDLVKEQILNAQNNEMIIKNNQLKSQLDEAKEKEYILQLELEENRLKLEDQEKINQEFEKLQNQEFEKLQEQKFRKLLEQKQTNQEFEKLQEQKQINQELEKLQEQKEINQELIKDEKSNNNLVNSYYEKFNQIRERIYEYMSPSISPSISTYIKTYFNTAKTCGFIYSLYDNSNNKSNISSSILESKENMPSLSQGQMYISNNKSYLILHYADKLGFTGINIPLNESSILITNGFSKYQLGLSEFNSNLDKLGYFSVKINLSGIPDDFFNTSSSYILCDCDSLAKNNILIENQLWNSFLIFIAVIILTVLIINYKYVYGLIIYFYSNKSDNDDSKIDGGKRIFYVGGYDYRDYSD